MPNDVTTQPDAKLLEQVLIGGDLGRLTASERISYYKQVCDSLGLNPLTRPFEYILLNGKLKLYALRDCTEQLRKIHGVSISNMRTELLPDEMYVVTADFTDKTGRTDQATGVVSLKGLQGENKGNKMMGAETKCKRRGTLSICGMGMLDETEVETIPGARVGEQDTGPPPLPKRLSERPESITMHEQGSPPVVSETYEPDSIPPEDLPISKQEAIEIYRHMRVAMRELHLETTEKNLQQAKAAVKQWAAAELGIEHLEDCPAGAPYLRLRGQISRLIRDAFPLTLGDG